MDSPTRIVIADDHAMFRQGLKSMLRLEPSVEVVGETGRLAEVMPLLAQARCDILLLDLGMERSSLIEISSFTHYARVIILTADENPSHALDAMRAGASAIVFKRFAVESLMDAIRAAGEGQVWMPVELQSHAVEAIRAEGRGDVLTRREREIIREVALGLRNAEVAAKLFISEQTVKTHLSNIFGKLGLRDRVELTLYAARVGIIGVHEKVTP